MADYEELMDRIGNSLYVDQGHGRAYIDVGKLSPPETYTLMKALRAAIALDKDIAAGSCNCGSDVSFQTYERCYTLKNPFFDGKSVTKKWASIDYCIIPEVLELWDQGIGTLESCCGHNKRQGYIAVADEYRKQIERIGYKPDPDAPHVYLSRTCGQSHIAALEGE